MVKVSHHVVTPSKLCGILKLDSDSTTATSAPNYPRQRLTESHSPRSASNSVMELHPPTPHPEKLPFFSLLRILLNDTIRLTGERKDDPVSRPKLSLRNLEEEEEDEEEPTGIDRSTSSPTGSGSHTTTATSDRVACSGTASTGALQSGHVAWDRNQASMHSVWKLWLHLGKVRPVSPFSNSDKQTAHSDGWVEAEKVKTGSVEMTEGWRPREVRAMRAAGSM